MSISLQRQIPILADTYTPQIEALLHNYCQSQVENATAIGTGIAELWQEIDRYVTGGGKRLRPRLFLMTYDFYNGSEAAPALHAACAWELLHASLLIHDDIIDRDAVRHGKLNIAGKYQEKYLRLTKSDAEHYALSAALLAGDLLIAAAHDIINQSGLTDSQKVAMQQYLHKAIFAVGGGELLDTESALYPIDSVDPYKVATYKTASYSFQLPMESGAALAGASPVEVSKLSEIGRHAGIAFQLKDDLLGVFGDSQTTGKSNRSDIVEKKRTLLVQYALASTPTKEAFRLRELYSKPGGLTDEEAEEAYRIIENTQAKTEIEALVTSYSESALDIVHTLATSATNKDALAALISSLIGRHA